jgi:hypothetical protein
VSTLVESSWQVLLAKGKKKKKLKKIWKKLIAIVFGFFFMILSATHEASCL